MVQAAESQTPFIFVIVPTHNRWAQLSNLLSSLAKSDYPNFQTVVIEDGCTDGTPQRCRAEYPEVHVVHGDGNLWWSGAINKGLYYALKQGADAILWINDDDFLEAGALNALVDSWKRNGKRSVISARVRSTDPDDKVEWVGQNAPLWHPDYDFPNSEPFDSTALDIPMKHPPGGHGLLFPAPLFHEIGLIDIRHFPHYHADHDFHYRAIKAGYQYILTPQAVVWNTPNAPRKEDKDEYSIKWIWKTLRNRYSLYNLQMLHLMIKRHAQVSEHQRLQRELWVRLFKFFASHWASRYPVLRRLIDMTKNTSQT